MTDAEQPEDGYTITPADVPAEPEHMHVATAFLVYVLPNGHTIASSEDVQGNAAKLVIERQATLNDMRRACHEVVDDVNNSIISQTTIQQWVAVTQQMARQAVMQNVMQNGPGGAPDLSVLKKRPS